MHSLVRQRASFDTSDVEHYQQHTIFITTICSKILGTLDRVYFRRYIVVYLPLSKELIDARIEITNKRATQIQIEVGSVQQDKGRQIESIVLYNTAQKARKLELRAEHPSILTSINNLTLIYSDRGLYSKAAELGEQVIEIRKKVLREEHPFTLISIDILILTFSN